MRRELDDIDMAAGVPHVDDPAASLAPVDELALLETLYREHYAVLVRVARILVGDRTRAEELTQDAFVRVHGRLGHVDHPPAYLRTTLVNLCRDHRRRERTVDRNPVAPPPPVEGPGIPDESTAVWHALQGLPDRQRVALTLRFYGDLATDDIATLLDVRPATVRSLLHRGLATLKETVSDDD